jgi:hypothetical protein
MRIVLVIAGYMDYSREHLPETNVRRDEFITVREWDDITGKN